MPGISVRCTGCGAGLKAPAGKSKVRCPQCKTVIHVPQPSEKPPEPVDELEEVDEAPARPRRRLDDDEDDRPRRTIKRRRREAKGDGPWLIAVAAAGACFVVSFGVTLLAFGTKGLPENQEEGGVLAKLASLAFGVVVALVLAGLGVLAVKNQKIYDRWGNATTGPLAVILGMVVTVLGGSLGGFVVYALLVALIRGH